MIRSGLNVGAGGATGSVFPSDTPKDSSSLPGVNNVYQNLDGDLGKVQGSSQNTPPAPYAASQRRVIAGNAGYNPFHASDIADPYKYVAPPVPPAPPVSPPPVQPPQPASEEQHNYFEDFESYGELHPNRGDVHQVGDWFAGEGNEIEILDEDTYLKNGSTNRVLETEAPNGGSNVYRDFATGKGEKFALSLDYSARDGHEADSVVDVYWEGKKIGTMSADKTGMQKFTFNVTAEAVDGMSRLEFRTQDGNSFGGVVDNISLESLGY